MTDREKLMFLEGIQFAGAALALEIGAQLNWLQIRVVNALEIPCAELSAITTELHRELDRGGFRGAVLQRRARSEQ